MLPRSRSRTLQAAGVLLLLIAPACSGPDPQPAAPAPPGDITLDVAGDVHFAGTSAAALEPGGLDAVKGVLADADVTVVNLETAVTTRGTPAGKQYTFRAPPSDRLAVFDATQVLDTSLASAWTATDDQPGLAAVRDAADRARLVAAVEAARGSADSVVVLLHWGRELDECPLPVQQDLAAALVAAGADAVVGSHAHRQLGNGWLAAGGRRAFEDYGLGNFVSSARGSGVTTRSGVLHLTLPGTGGVSAAQWRPAQIRDGLNVPLEGDAAAAAVAAKAALRPCTDLATTP